MTDEFRNQALQHILLGIKDDLNEQEDSKAYYPLFQLSGFRGFDGDFQE